jgi:uncharacterized cupredoxin-like copper-binding protein
MNKKILGAVILVLAIVLTAAIGVKAFATAPQYAPQTRTMTIIEVPLVVHEMQDTLDYLKVDFAAGGVLEGKEIYGFYPSTITVYKGDTLNLTIVNPADDDHTFTMTGMAAVDSVTKGRSVNKLSFVAKQAGIFTFYCNEPEHAPYMWGQLVVLPDSQATGE